MSDTVTCAGVRELAPDLALGALPGDERAQLLAHLARCPHCEALVADLSRAADGLLQLAPESDPPAGFESRVLARIRAEDGTGGRPTVARRRRPGGRPLVAALLVATAAAIAAIAGVAGYTTHHVDPYPAAVGALRLGPLVGPEGERWGEAVVSGGDPAWVFVAMRWDVPDGAYRVELDRASGPGSTLDGLDLSGGQGTVGRLVAGAADITQVRVVDQAGRTICTASLARA